MNQLNHTAFSARTLSVSACGRGGRIGSWKVNVVAFGLPQKFSLEILGTIEAAAQDLASYRCLPRQLPAPVLKYVLQQQDQFEKQ